MNAKNMKSAYKNMSLEMLEGLYKANLDFYNALCKLRCTQGTALEPYNTHFWEFCNFDKLDVDDIEEKLNELKAVIDSRKGERVLMTRINMLQSEIDSLNRQVEKVRNS